MPKRMEGPSERHNCLAIEHVFSLIIELHTTKIYGVDFGLLVIYFSYLDASRLSMLPKIIMLIL